MNFIEPSPIFNTLRQQFAEEQCSDCKDMGWPEGLFLCTDGYILCSDY